MKYKIFSGDAFFEISFIKLLAYFTMFFALVIFVSCIRRRDRSIKQKPVETQIQIPNDLKIFYPYKPNDSIIIEHQFYHLSYNEALEQPIWVVYKLTKEMVRNNLVSRSNDYRDDLTVSTGSASLDDYSNSGYDRGHLVPAADMKFSMEAMSETFYLSNISPQVHDFNGGIWLTLENKVRNWALEYDSLIIIMGPLGDSCIDWIGPDSVCVPARFFKVILDISPPDYKGIAFIFNNEPQNGSIFSHSLSIDSIEFITGIDFFAKLNLVDIDSIESIRIDTLWSQ